MISIRGFIRYAVVSLRHPPGRSLILSRNTHQPQQGNSGTRSHGCDANYVRWMPRTTSYPHRIVSLSQPPPPFLCSIVRGLTHHVHPVLMRSALLVKGISPISRKIYKIFAKKNTFPHPVRLHFILNEHLTIISNHTNNIQYRVNSSSTTLHDFTKIKLGDLR